MGLPRDLVELEAWIRKRADVDLFSPIERGGLLMTRSWSLLCLLSPPGSHGLQRPSCARWLSAR
jgi:hypothetical protein